MWPFRRREDVSTTDASNEKDDYYRTERRERVGLAWLLALASLVATILIALALFYGVRFIYHKIHHTNSPSATTSTSTGTVSEPSTSQSGTSGQSTSGQTNAPGSGTTSTPSVATPSGSSAGSSSNIANTGPGSTISIFVAVSLLGVVAHHLYSRRKVSQEL